MNWSPKLGLNCASSHLNCHGKMNKQWLIFWYYSWTRSIQIRNFSSNWYLNPNEIASSKNNSVGQACGNYTSIRHLPYPCYIGMHNALSSPPSSTSTAHCHAASSSHLQIRLSPSPSSFGFPPNSPQPFLFLCVAAPQSLFTLSSSFPDSPKFPGRAYLNPPDLPLSSCLGNYLVNREYFLFSFWHSCLQPFIYLSLSRWGNRGLTRIEYSMQGVQWTAMSSAICSLCLSSRLSSLPYLLAVNRLHFVSFLPPFPLT